jgi:Arc/MetJ-type ribon-helix-helix transcriptional regulator
MSPRKRYSFWINDVQAAGLKLVKESEDISESEQIRQALNEWLKKRNALKVKTERKRVSPRSRS